MKSISLFTDISLDPKLRRGVGAFLALPSSSPAFSPELIQGPEIAGHIITKRLGPATSTTLEILTALWALEDCRREFRKPQTAKLILYSDSQCIADLLQRRRGLEAKCFLSNRTGQLLANTGLYRAFYALHDELEFEVIKVPGHSRYSSHTAVQRIFSFVDRKARKELRLWMAERKAEGITEAYFFE